MKYTKHTTTYEEAIDENERNIVLLSGLTLYLIYGATQGVLHS